MKKTVYFSSIVVTLFLSSCATTFNRALLEPTTEYINPKLPKLEFNKEESVTKFRSDEGQMITENSKMYTLFERELPNICNQNGDIKGTIEPVIILKEQSRNYTFFVISAFTGLTINLIGFPYWTDIYQLEVEFVIKDNTESVLWKKSYYTKKNVTTGLYYNALYNVDEKYIIMFKQMIKDLKTDLQAEAVSISNNFKQ